MQSNLEAGFDAKVWCGSAAVFLAACWINGAEAQVAAAPLEGVVISGNRTVTPLADTGSDVSIITSEELEQRQIRFVSEPCVRLRVSQSVVWVRSAPIRRFGFEVQKRITPS